MDGGMKQAICQMVLVVVVLIGINGCVTQAAVPGTSVSDTKASVASTLVLAKKPAWLTPEKEAALVAVRKILREAKQAAESYTLPSMLTTSSTMLRALGRRKTMQLEEIEQAQLRAGDLAAAAGTKRLDLLALAQAQYGDIQGAIQTASRESVTDDQLLTLVDTLIKARDIPAAIAVAQSNLAKHGVKLWRQRNQAAVYALIARRQHEVGDLQASATLQKAIKSVPEPTHTPDRYLALLHVARAQVQLGDRAGSAESFRKATEAALSVGEDGVKGGGLIWVAKAQAVLLVSIAKTLVSTHDPLGSPEVFQQLAESAAALLKHSPPTDSSKRNTMRFSLARVQAAAGDVPSALRTADTISQLSLRVQAYGRAAKLLTAKADFAHAKQVIQAMEEEWLAWFESESAVRNLAQAQTRTGDEPAAITWARQQNNMYAKGDALLGAALGRMEREGFVDIERSTLTTPMRDQCPIWFDSYL